MAAILSRLPPRELHLRGDRARPGGRARPGRAGPRLRTSRAAARRVVELARDSARREWTFGEVADAARRLAGRLHALGVRRGDVVLTLVGNRPEWAFAMLACFRAGYVVLPCTEQLRAKDLALRLE